MNEDLSKLVENLSGNNEVPNNIKELLNSFVSNNKSCDSADNTTSSSNQEKTSSIINNSSNNDSPNIDIDTILKIKKIFDSANSTQNSNSINLLRSLKPYLKENKKDKVEQYIKLLNMSQYLDIFNNIGGEAKK